MRLLITQFDNDNNNNKINEFKSIAFVQCKIETTSIYNTIKMRRFNCHEEMYNKRQKKRSIKKIEDRNAAVRKNHLKLYK